MYLRGLKIVPAPYAIEAKTEFVVARYSPGRSKRRKNWRVLRIEIDRPSCYQVGEVLYVHPELIEKLKQKGL